MLWKEKPMAKINEQKVVIKLSQLVRDDETSKDILTDEMLAALIEALQEMVGSNTLIELE